MAARPPSSVVVAMIGAGIVALELVLVALRCVPYIDGGEGWLRAFATVVLCLGVAAGSVAFIAGSLQRRPEVRATAVGWSVPLGAALALLTALVGLFALWLGARPAMLALLGFAVAVVLPVSAVGLALLRPSAREWFEADGPRMRRARRP